MELVFIFDFLDKDGDEKYINNCKLPNFII